MIIQDDTESSGSCTGNDPIHHLQRAQVGEIRILLIIDPRGLYARGQHGIGEWQADDVVAQLMDLIQHISPVALPQSMWSLNLGLEAEPIHTTQAHRLSRRIQDLITRGMEVIGSYGFLFYVHTQ